MLLLKEDAGSVPEFPDQLMFLLHCKPWSRTKIRTPDGIGILTAASVKLNSVLHRSVCLSDSDAMARILCLPRSEVRSLDELIVRQLSFTRMGNRFEGFAG